jgi:hypothetical protein
MYPTCFARPDSRMALLLVVLACSGFRATTYADGTTDPEQTQATPGAGNPDNTDETKSTLFDRWFDKFENMRDETSQHYMAMARSIDRYFSGEKIEDSSNNSYVKMELQDTFYKDGNQDNGISLNAKLDLPDTQKRLKLIFNSNPEEEKTLEQRIVDNATGQRIQNENSIAGVEYASDKLPEQWEHKFISGVKLRIDPIPFMRYQIGKNWQLDDGWESGFKQSFWDYRDDGLGATTKIDFGKHLTAKNYLKIETLAEYRDHDTQYDYAQTITNTHSLTTSSAISYWVGALGQSQPTSEVTAYLMGIKYRRSLYRDWLLLSISPLLTFPRDDDWKASPSITFDLQIFFTTENKPLTI